MKRRSDPSLSDPRLCSRCKRRVPRAAARCPWCLGAGANDVGPIAFDAFEIRSSELNGRLSIPTPSLRSAIQKVGRTPVEREPYSVKSLPPKPRREELVLV